MRDARLLQAIYGQVWAVEPLTGAAMLNVIQRHSTGEKLSKDAIEAAIEGHTPHPRAQQTVGGAMVISVLGVIAHRASMVHEVSSGVGASVESITKRFRAAMADPEVLTVIFDVDSPGGSVHGVQEIAREIYDARNKKHIIAVCNGTAASAAFWIASAATELVASPSSQIGSVGVIAAHEDVSRLMEKEGIAITLVHHGEHKVETNPYRPLGDEARAHLQRSVDEYGEKFVRDLAHFRNTTAAHVKARFGQGRMFGSQEALNRGLVDRIATLDQVISEAQARRRGPYAPRRAAASAQLDHITAATRFPRREAARAELDRLENDARFPKRAAARAALDKLDAKSRRRSVSVARARLALLG